MGKVRQEEVEGKAIYSRICIHGNASNTMLPCTLIKDRAEKEENSHKRRLLWDLANSTFTSSHRILAVDLATSCPKLSKIATIAIVFELLQSSNVLIYLANYAYSYIHRRMVVVLVSKIIICSFQKMQATQFVEEGCS